MKSIYFLILILIISCDSKPGHDKNNGQKKSNSIILEVPINNEEFEIQNKQKNPIYIALETKHDNKISSVDKIEFFDNKIFIFDEKLNQIFIFNEEGRFLKQIDSKGRGPYEYNYVSDFNVNHTDSCMQLLDVGGRKVFYLDASYNVIDKINITFFCNRFINTSNNNYLFFTNNQITPTAKDDNFYNFILTNKNGKIIDNFMPIPGEMQNLVVSEPNTFTSYKSGAIFSLPFDNRIYFVNCDSVITKYWISFGKYNLPQNFLNPLKENKKNNKAQLQMKLLNNIVNAGYAYSIHSLFENETFLFFQFRKTTKLYSVLYNKKRKSIKTGVNKLNSLESVLFGHPVALNNANELISVIFPFEYYELIKSTKLLDEENENKYKEFSNKLNITNSVNKFDNPVLKFSKLSQ